MGKAGIVITAAADTCEEDMGKRIVMTCPETGERSLTPPSCRLHCLHQTAINTKFTHACTTSANASILAGVQFAEDKLKFSTLDIFTT